MENLLDFRDFWVDPAETHIFYYSESAYALFYADQLLFTFNNLYSIRYAIIINVHIMLSTYINLKKKAVAELFSRKSTLFKKWIKLFPYAGSSLILLHPGQ